MEYPRIKAYSLIYVALLFKENKIIKKYIDAIKQKRIATPSYVNCTSEDMNMPHLDNHVFIIMRITKLDPYFDRIVAEFHNSRHYLTKHIVYIDNSQHWCFVFNYPFEHYRECGLVRDGLYSKLDFKTKTNVLKYWDQAHCSHLSLILNNTDNAILRDGTPLTRNELGEYYNKPSSFVPLSKFDGELLILQ